MIRKNLISMLMVSFVSLGLVFAGCGGTVDQDVSTAAPGTLQGVAATGMPISGTVTLTDASPAPKKRTTVTGADGSFAFIVGGLTPPFVLTAEWTESTGKKRLHAITEAPGTTNINPFADTIFIAASGAYDTATMPAYPDPALSSTIAKKHRSIRDRLLIKLAPLFALYGTADDPVDDHYDANHTGLDALLDDIKITVSNGMIIVTNKKTGSIIFQAPVSNIDSGAFTPANMPGQPGQVDGAALYAGNCSSCHKALASSTVKGATAAGIQAAIKSNTGGMGSLVSLTALQIQAIASTLAGITTPPPPTTDGAALYANNCSSCHKALASSTVKVATTASIQTAIRNNTGGMGTLSGLTSAQITAIATALTGGVTPPPPAACAYTYSVWGTCQSDSTQLRTVLTTTPAGCSGTPVLTRSCTYVPPQPKACTYTYSVWGDCQSNNTQLRTLLTTTPAGCTGTPALSQSCAYVPPAIDGAALYTQYCNECHGNGKKGKTASAIQNAINNNTGGMGTAALKGLTSAQIAAISAATTVIASGAPRILYTDIVSGPNSGGENGKGAYLSLFGKNFGSSGLGTTVKVYINNMEVDNYRYLGASKGRPDIQQITVQVGALGNPAPGVALPIRVTVLGVDSNTNHSFMVQPGKTWFVALTGNDATCVADDINRPCRHVQLHSSTGSDGTIGKMAPGDFLIMRGGTWSDLGFDDGSAYFLKFMKVTGNAATGASGHGPLTIMGYPGEDVHIFPAAGTAYGGISGVNRENYPAYSTNIVLSNLRVEVGSASHDGPVNSQRAGANWRVVNTDLSMPTAPSSSRSGGICGSGTNMAWLGNYIHDIAGDGETDHGIYIDNGNGAEIAYNRIIKIPGGSGIQTYNTTGAATYNINIHHNWIDTVNKHGINIGDGTSTGIVIYNNVIANTQRGGIRFNNSLSGASSCRIYNNTIYNTVLSGSYKNGDLYAAIMTDSSLPSNAIDMRNNIVYPSANSAYLGGAVGIDASDGTFSNNLWYGVSVYGSAPSFDANKITANPLFVSVGADFHLQPSSPAIDHGTATNVSAVETDDYDAFISRPQGIAYDIGAFEYAL